MGLMDVICHRLILTLVWYESLESVVSTRMSSSSFDCGSKLRGVLPIVLLYEIEGEESCRCLESPPAVTNWKGRVRPSGCERNASERATIRGASAFIPRRLAPVFWSGFFTVTQSLCLIGLESAEGYPLTVSDIPKRGKILMTPLYHDIFMRTMPLPSVERVTLFGGVKRRIHQIRSAVNNNRADVKITVVTLGTGDLPSLLPSFRLTKLKK
ncbi:hypothetical protein TNCV_3060911 [Trichonephila clavipes]|nr:hypothetical protein TNCV_3060911 [Trichonephila clavipes]